MFDLSPQQMTDDVAIYNGFFQKIKCLTKSGVTNSMITQRDFKETIIAVSIDSKKNS